MYNDSIAVKKGYYIMLNAQTVVVLKDIGVSIAKNVAIIGGVWTALWAVGKGLEVIDARKTAKIYVEEGPDALRRWFLAEQKAATVDQANAMVETVALAVESAKKAHQAAQPAAQPAAPPNGEAAAAAS